MKFFFDMRSSVTDKLNNYDYIIETCNYNYVKNKRKIHSWQEMDPIEKSLNNILNKLSDTNYNQICDDITRLFNVLSTNTFKNENIDEKKFFNIHYYICYTLISRAIIDTKYLSLYAKLCKTIATITKDEFIIKVCEHLFYHEIKKSSRPHLFTFLSMLFNEKLLSKKIMIYILDTLYELEQYDKVCNIIKLLDKNEFEFHYNKIIKLSQNKSLPNIIRFKIMDILEI